ncbi:MAG TPA: NAD(P)H-binding protein, partial [Chitinophagaceae bacterium]|nr:NAD(P)H-binding protein [Chitinophagaceae bacterium]
KDKTRSLGIKNIIEQMLKANVHRLLAVAGMGILKDDEYEYIQNRKNYPAAFYYVSREHLQAYMYMKESPLRWTLVCPPDIRNEDATGKYITAADYPPSPNKYSISAGDIADFLLNEVVNNHYECKRVGISN